ncbi:MAG TPA: 2'-5' RNA ligase family protein, partial [Solirubrobacteraceae bacterium]|nr:2'-5' RNA ligase family protein [Solirubrobacteraceae bacterium]
MRLFVALDLPSGVVAALSAWAGAAERPGLRILPAASLHVTLAFLGERPDGEADAIGSAVLAAAGSAPVAP